jgi:hypothetical protein
MIRPVLYVDLPGILYALDRRARAAGRPFATFLCNPRYEETRSGLAGWLDSMSPVHASARTWICEERWRLLGVAQARPRDDATSWDLVYLASMTQDDRETVDVLRGLLEYAVNAAMLHNMQRIYAQIAEDDGSVAIFHRVGFQRYAQEEVYVRPTPVLSETDAPPQRGLGIPETQFRRWHAHDVWGLAQLHQATTPRRVQVAELLDSSELVHQLVPRPRTWRIPGVEPRDESYVVDVGSHLAAWVRVRQGWAGLPHQIWLKVHPDHAALIAEVIQFGLRRLCQNGIVPGTHPNRQPVICQIRDYDGKVIDTLRQLGFTHADTKTILVRHLTLRAFTDITMPAVEQSGINYGVEGLGAVRSLPLAQSRVLHSCNKRSRMTSNSSSPPCRRTSRQTWRSTRSSGN